MVCIYKFWNKRVCSGIDISFSRALKVEVNRAKGEIFTKTSFTVPCLSQLAITFVLDSYCLYNDDTKLVYCLSVLRYTLRAMCREEPLFIFYWNNSTACQGWCTAETLKVSMHNEVYMCCNVVVFNDLS